MEDKVEKYLNGNLAGEDLSSFEKELANNAELREEVKIQQEVAEMLLETKAENLRENLQKIMQHSSDVAPEVQVKALRPTVWWIAASITLIALIGLAIFFNSKSPLSQEEIFTAHFKPYQNVLSYRNSVDGDSLLALGMEYYDSKNYDQALKVLKNVTDENELISSFYVGISLLAIDSAEQARSVFVKIIDSDNMLLLDAAKWYYSLALVKTDDLNEAIKVLKEISQSESSYYRHDAKLVLELVEERALSVYKVEALEEAEVEALEESKVSE